MVKKVLSCLILILSTTVILSCTPSTDNEGVRPPNGNTNWYLGSHNEIIIQDDISDEVRNQHYENIHAIFRDYHILTSSFEGFDNVNNVYTINNSDGKWVKVDRRLFDILQFAYNFQIDNEDLPFNILMGEITMIWKAFIDRTNDSLPSESLLSSLVTIMNASNLEFNHDDSEVRIVGGASLDLGAVTKGYVTQLVHQYFQQHNINYFQMNSGTSSIHLGQNINRPTRNWHIGILQLNGVLIHKILGLQNSAISTSGSHVQRRRYPDATNGDVYTHIVNPFTGSAKENEVGSISIISNETAMSDILTTAFFHLPVSKIKEIYQDFGIQITITNTNDEFIYISPGLVELEVTR